MKKIKLLIDEVGFERKPIGNEVAQIQVRLRDEKAIKEVTIDEFFESIKKGQSFCPGLTKNGTKNDNWEQQDIVAIDIDNENGEIITPEKAIAMLKEKNIEPTGYYHTFNSTNEKPKFRLIFTLNSTTTDKKKIEFIIETLIEFINGDRACKNLARIFYGTNGKEKEVVILNPEATITLDSIIALNNKISTDDEFKGNELNSLIKDFDLLEYMKKDNEFSHSSSDVVYFKNCCICGHHDCLRYYPKTNTFYCFGQNGCIGGSIIDYLMATKNFDKKEAISYFKYEILKLPKNQVVVKNDFIDPRMLEIVRKQITEIGLNSDFVNENNFNWIIAKIKNSEVKYSVSCSLLHEFLKKNLNYKFVKNGAKEGTLRYYFFDGYYQLISDQEIQGLIKHFIPLELQSSGITSEVSKQLYTDLNFIKLEQLNNDENIINFKNGILHLDTGEFKSHSPEYLNTIRIPCNYKENIEVPNTRYFDNFINTLTNGDEEIKRLILQFMGVVISNVKGYRMKKMLIMVGKGNTGKSVLKNFLTTLIGKDNFSNIDLRKMEDKFGKIQLLNKRLVGSNDMSWAKVAEMETLKQAVGGDPIYAEFKGENGINFVFNGVLWYCTNQLPMFGGDKGDWVYDRIVIVECNNVIPEDKQDKKLVEHLLQEKDYIVSLAIKGLLEVIKNGYRYDIPESCNLLNEQYKIDNSSFRTFLEECCIDRVPGEKIPDDGCTKGKIHKVYREWYKENNRGYHYDTTSEIRKLLESMGKYNIVTANKGNEYYADFTLGGKVMNEYKHILGINILPTSEEKIQLDIDDIDNEEILF